MALNYSKLHDACPPVRRESDTPSYELTVKITVSELKSAETGLIWHVGSPAKGGYSRATNETAAAAGMVMQLLGKMERSVHREIDRRDESPREVAGLYDKVEQQTAEYRSRLGALAQILDVLPGESVAEAATRITTDRNGMELLISETDVLIDALSARHAGTDGLFNVWKNAREKHGV